MFHFLLCWRRCISIPILLYIRISWIINWVNLKTMCCEFLNCLLGCVLIILYWKQVQSARISLILFASCCFRWKLKFTLEPNITEKGVVRNPQSFKIILFWTDFSHDSRFLMDFLPVSFNFPSMTKTPTLIFLLLIVALKSSPTFQWRTAMDLTGKIEMKDIKLSLIFSVGPWLNCFLLSVFRFNCLTFYNFSIL